MCGIAGMMSYRGTEHSHIVSEMAERIRYRGPANSGVWCDLNYGLALGHVRLSILDLSPTGHQSLHLDSGQDVVISKW
jgi:asparagine synthase (glutamine-hydrolysing)